MKTDLFDYSLPDRLIAQKPADRRDESRLLVVDRKTRVVAHRHFRDLPDYLRAGDCLFRNNAAVIPARLHATRPTGGQVECLLLRPVIYSQNLTCHREGSEAHRGDPAGLLRRDASRNDSATEWWCLLRPGKKLSTGATFGLEGIFTATVREKTGDGLVRVLFETNEGDILAVANRIGEMPLPPYIAGRHSEEERNLDRERYQTVYADHDHQVAAAAPTAGLHFTPELLAQLVAQEIAFADLTLHVGLGTFRPIATKNIEDHAIHREFYEISAATLRALFATKGRRVAVGTTTVRTIEDYLSRHPGFECHREAGEACPVRFAQGRLPGDPAPRLAPGLELVETAGLVRRQVPRNESSKSDHIAEASLFIYPPRQFRGVDALITNFHQPRSTLLCLVAAFLTPGSTDGIAWLKEIYTEAVAREYRFFSYGDAMLIL